jgi:hypothetical protein
MKKSLISLAVAAFLLWPALASADSAPPSKNVTINFTQNDQPITSPVDFTIICTGQKINKMTGEKSQMQEVSLLTGTCDSPGCSFGAINIFEVYAATVDHCDLTGTINGQEFTVDNIISPDKQLNCQRAGFDIYDGRYWQETPEYKQCRDAVFNEYYPNDKYICHNSLEAVSEDECGGYGFITMDGQCYRFTEETNQCIAGQDAKYAECDKFLIDMTDQLARDDEGYAYEQLCSVDVALPVDLNTNEFPDLHTDPIPYNPPKTGWFDQLWQAVSCFFARLFGGQC